MKSIWRVGGSVLILLVAILLYQNCSPRMSFQGSDTSVSAQAASGGNGDGYDGKLVYWGQQESNLSSNSCAGSLSSRIEIQNEKATFFPACDDRQARVISNRDLLFSATAHHLIAFNGKIFDASYSTSVDQGVWPRLLCLGVSQEQVVWQVVLSRDGSLDTARVERGLPGDVSEFVSTSVVERFVSAGGLTYSSESINIQIAGALVGNAVAQFPNEPQPIALTCSGEGFVVRDIPLAFIGGWNMRNQLFTPVKEMSDQKSGVGLEPDDSKESEGVTYIPLVPVEEIKSEKDSGWIF